ncbi:MAG: efflux RND transporter periplasmic adaptor subunit [Solidesulfovibrio sp.]|jgi:HlyD family secretion protein/macrolide-specific efflux system membrane fusion protein|uniref:efflux RND transporter periplasmic adaptor subunit n=1 Tax=Solidesulfovibrio sp. TaxID=2910990 RepID=UPI002B20B32D|nr:efflux RND transporter periplasmic adaptor subunit [Solidesulfovibrio sp.]MEA4856396.1 efflux RND transporter periplasmic adaptor subunit [Solidesulfovibrio sp.]
MRIAKWLFFLALLAGGGLFTWQHFHKTIEPPRVLATAEAQIGDVRKVLEATGIIKAQVGAIVKIGARATGTIKEMNVKVGDEVRTNQLIAVIDDRELRAQLDEAQAKLARATAELAQVEAVYPKRIAEAQAEERLSQAKSEYAAANLKRQEELYAKSLIARDVLDAARRDALVGQNEVLARQASQVRLETEFEKERFKAQKAKEEAEAVIESVKTKISYTRIVSPIDGVVAFVTSQAGETVVAGLQVANLITVLDPSRLEMWIYVDETDVGQVRPGLPVEFRVDAQPGTTFSGSVDQIYPQPEIRDNIVYYQALVRLDPRESTRLRPEMTTQCQIVVQEKKGVLVIPNAALKWLGNRQVVFAVGEGDTVREVQPKLGLEGLNETEVTEGLAPGEKVATQIVLPGLAAPVINAPKPNRPTTR